MTLEELSVYFDMHVSAQIDVELRRLRKRNCQVDLLEYQMQIEGLARESVRPLMRCMYVALADAIHNLRAERQAEAARSLALVA